MTALPLDAQAIRYGKLLPRVYISGPYSKPYPEINLSNTAKVCKGLASTGLCIPFAPLLLSHAWEEREQQSYEFWIEYTKHLMVGCDVLFRIPGESDGADGEVELARSMGIPVIVSEGDSGRSDAERLLDWLKVWRSEHTWD